MRVALNSLLASLLLTTIAAPSLAQYSEDTPWPPPRQSQYPQAPYPYGYAPQGAYQYPPRPYDPYQTRQYPYRYPPQPRYQYPPQPTNQAPYRYPARQAYQDQPPQAYGYAQPEPSRYQAPPVQSAPAPQYQPLPAAGAPPPADGVLLTPDQQGSKDIANAATAPLHDLNLTRQAIPPVLMAALADPYAAPPAFDCATLAAEVGDLTSAMGPDYDNQPPHHARGVTESGGLGLTLVHGAAASLLPYDGFFKTLTGATAHDHLVTRALAAGGARRAYLKGLGEDRQCGGASPRHQAVPAATVEDSPWWRPKYRSWWDQAG
jgi:hypothetical protein